MSVRTKRSKSWAKQARGELKPKDWKNTLPKFYKQQTTTSASGKLYTSYVPYTKLSKKKHEIHQDMVTYLQSMFGGFL